MQGKALCPEYEGIYRTLQRYNPDNEQEQADRAVLLRCCEELPELLTRENRLAHFTASAWVVSPDREKVLMVFHNIFQSWSWMGGHADGESDLLAVALREVREESGVQSVRPITEELFSLETLCVKSHYKRGMYVPNHLHLNLGYLLEAEDMEPLRVKPDENSGVRWLPVPELLDAVSEPEMLGIYAKLMERAKQY